MGWIWIDDAIFTHPKIVTCPTESKLLFLSGLAWCNQHRTDGHINRNATRIICAWAGVSSKAARHLVDAGLWHKTGDGYEVHDYLDYQQSSAQAAAARERNRERQRLFRQRRKAASHPDRDAVTDSVSNGDSNAVTNPECNTVTNDTNPLPTSSNSLLEHLRARPTSPQETRDTHPDTPPADPLAARLHQVLTDAGGRGPTASLIACNAVIGHLRQHVDPHVIDEQIGYCATLDQPPRTAKYLVTVVQRWMAERGEHVPDLPTKP